ncbi:MAG: cytochrome c family protein [Gemmatimonadota bacterium]|nr:cytochrome c family protein [Gemmatimonadota bacterium]
MIPTYRNLAALLAVGGLAGLAMASGGLRPAVTPDVSPGTDRSSPGVQQARPLSPLLSVEEYTATGMTAAEAIEAHNAATEGPVQPVPFNHRFHVQEIGMQCAYCHGGTQSSPVATMPAVDTCMGCHRIVGAQLEPIADLRGYWDRGEPVPWERVYKVPDFVQFPHDAHIRNDLACAECHGAVEEMDRISKAFSLKMGWCLACHMGVGEESDYATDRLLAEQFVPPAMPAGRQPIGLYPRALDTAYGASRGPIDCAACHY